MQRYHYRMYKVIVSALVASSVMLFTIHSHAEIYRWTDEHGKVHFSDKPVGDKAKVLDIKVKPAAPVSAKTRDERKQKADNFLRARQEERAENDKQQREKKQRIAERKAKCSEAKHEYRETIEAGAVYYRKKDGTRDFLEPERRKKEEARLKAEIKKWCK